MSLQMPVWDVNDALLSETVPATDMWTHDMSEELEHEDSIHVQVRRGTVREDVKLGVVCR